MSALISSAEKLKLVFTLLIIFFIETCEGGCYFPYQLRGEYVMQSTAGSQVQYSQVNITEESIPIWGQCHRRIGNNVILMDISGGGNCFRCFHLNLRSKNVLQVLTEGLDKCYTKEDAAVATCPGEHLNKGQNSLDRLKEMLLYKTKELGGEDIRKEYCPINGHYTFTYNVNEGSENKAECPDPVSELDNCPSAFGLNLRFRRCSFENHDITFQCLGHWAGTGGQKYLALLDTRVGGDKRAQYRCALYQENPATGVINMAFSSDSTCTSDLRSATEGFETMILNPIPSPLWPPRVESSTCRFPSWSQGRWEHLDIKSNTLTYKDHSVFKTSTIKCIDFDTGSPEKFLTFSRNHCGEERYTCIWMKKRDTNVMDFQLGIRSSAYFNTSLCSDSNFQKDAWFTQGKTDIIKESPCPIAGEYTGELPDSKILCAKLYSDCNNPEIMFYTMYDCSKQPEQPEVFEEREYRCLGQWEEDGLMYTYTQRRDVGNSYECFVGSIKSNTEFYIKEAGEHCRRHTDPRNLEMKLTKRGEAGSCFGVPPTTMYPPRMPPPHPRPTSSWHSSKRPPEPTKPWKPITAPPRDRIQNNASSLLHPTFGAILAVFLFLWV